MKHRIQQSKQKALHVTTCLFIGLCTFFIAAGSNQLFAQSAEETAIKQVLKDAPTAFYKRDAQTWQALWKHSPQTSITRATSLSYNSNAGWDKIRAAAEKAMKDNPEPLPINIVQENFVIHVGGNLATAEFDQTLSNFPDEPDTKFKSHQVTILQKENNKWKLVSNTSHNAETYANTPEAIEARINATGYSLLSANKVDEAIDLFMLNVKLYPAAWNVYDSLGEAYALKGNKELAIKNYEKSMELNPKNDVGKLALTKLKE